VSLLVTDFDHSYVALGVQTIVIANGNKFNVELPANFISALSSFQ